MALELQLTWAEFATLAGVRDDDGGVELLERVRALVSPEEVDQIIAFHLAGGIPSVRAGHQVTRRLRWTPVTKS
jgi:hypothetical protein